MVLGAVQKIRLDRERFFCMETCRIFFRSFFCHDRLTMDYSRPGNSVEIIFFQIFSLSWLLPLNYCVDSTISQGAVYTEMSIRRNDTMNEVIKAGEVFKLAELVPYADGKIVNMDVVHNDTMKFVVMAFDEGTGLSEHVAPGEAIIFALDGEGVIGYEGKD